MKDELTEAMHNELSVSPATEIMHRVFTALSTIDDGTFSRARACEIYGVTEAQIQQHEAEYRKLKE